MASNYRGYAQRRGFDPIKAPTQIIDRFLEQQNNYGNQLRRNQEIKQRQEQQVQDQKNKNFAIEQQNRQMVEMSDRRNEAAIRDAKLKNLNTQYKNALRGVEEANGYAQALAGFSQSLGKSIETYRARVYEEKFAAGMQMVYEHGISPEEWLELTMGEAQSEVTSDATERLVDQMMERGVSGEVIERIRNLTGPQKLGAEKALMVRAGESYQEFVSDNYETEYEVGNGLTMSRAEAESTNNMGALRVINSLQNQEYFKKFSSFDPTMASKYMMEPMRKWELDYMRNQSAAKDKQVRAQVAADRKNETYLVAETEGVPGLVNRYYARGQASGSKSGVAIERSKTVNTIAEGVKSGALDVSIAEEFLDHQVTIKGQQPKAFSDLYPAEAAVLEDAVTANRRKVHSEWQLIEAERGRSQSQFNDSVREALYSGEFSNEQVEPLMNKAIADDNKELVSMLKTFMSTGSVDAKQEKAFEEDFEEQYAIGNLTQDMVFNSPLSPEKKQKWLKLAGGEGGQIKLDTEDNKQIKDYVESALKNARTDGGKADASISNAQAFALRDIKRHITAQVRQGADIQSAIQSGLTKFNQELKDENGKYRTSSAGDYNGVSADGTPFTIPGGAYKFDMFDLDQNNGELMGGMRPLTDFKAILKNDPNALREKTIVNPGMLQQYRKQVSRTGRGVMPPVVYDLAKSTGLQPIDVMNMQLRSAGMEPVVPPNFDRATANAIDPRISRLLNRYPTKQNAMIAQQSFDQGHSPGEGPNIQYTPEQRQALDIIGRYESDSSGGYNAMNEGGADGGRTVVGYSGPAKERLGRDLTSMTVGEVMKLQQQGKLHAAGRYQFIGNTLPEVVRKAGLSEDTVFSPATQDLLGLTLLGYGGYGRWVGLSKASAAEIQSVRIAAAQEVSLGPSPFRQGNTMQFEVIEHVTGHQGHSNYAADHAGGNYHEHVAFKSKAQRDMAIRYLRQAGFKFGGRQIDRPDQSGSYHSTEQAIDIGYYGNEQFGTPEEMSKAVWDALGIMGIRRN